ncbi:hypothetical protein AQUCO_02200313v1 [Aquilegia coerulea]|uniref:Uncharacterized protein n=1 Tax=Aquilegia coerulea TaxID=218851 RepID=A0A2G5DF02_AQUCA|nr:hypothetical protein AQUCO_02200313v1 [Aquilegia coerulea]
MTLCLHECLLTLKFYNIAFQCHLFRWFYLRCNYYYQIVSEIFAVVLLSARVSFKVMKSTPGSNIYINLPALKKLDSILLVSKYSRGRHIFWKSLLLPL